MSFRTSLKIAGALVRTKVVLTTGFLALRVKKYPNNLVNNPKAVQSTENVWLVYLLSNFNSVFGKNIVFLKCC